ncbi:MAG: hypothetical protein H3C43_11710 [Leptonema sp. (in: Bacteria)]|nr:hypothetical protein [Leptonema sp. (in: bacteria)]
MPLQPTSSRSVVSDGILFLLAFSAGAFAFLLWMLFSTKTNTPKREKDQIKGYCPICGHDLRKGERMQSNQLQIGKTELRTFISGCPFCLSGSGSGRKCPVCKRKLKQNETAVAFSNPELDKKRLEVRGCKKCYPQGYETTKYV